MREFSTSAGHVADACNCRKCGGSGSGASDGAGDGDEPLDEAALNRLIDEYGVDAVADALRDIRDGDDHVSGQSAAGRADPDEWLSPGPIASMQTIDGPRAAGGESTDDDQGDGSDAVWAPYGGFDANTDEGPPVYAPEVEDAGESDDGEVAGYDIGGVVDSLKSDDE